MQDPKWIAPLFAAIDAQNTAAFVEFLATDAEMRFGNGPSMVGHEAIHPAIEGFFGAIKGLQHNIFNVWPVENTVIVEGEVVYTRHDEKQVTTPFCNVFHLDPERPGLVARYFVYVDQTPLFAP